MKSTHYFIGISVKDDYLIERLVHNQRWLCGHMNYKVWSTPEDFHLTLRFLGEVKDLSYWKELVEKASAYPSFRADVGGIGFFGNKETPRVVYQSVSLPEGLRQLYDYFQETSGKEFSPHITLAKKWRGGNLPSLGSEDDFSWKIRNCSLFRIHPGKTPKYEQVTSAVLKDR